MCLLRWRECGVVRLMFSWDALLDLSSVDWLRPRLTYLSGLGLESKCTLLERVKAEFLVVLPSLKIRSLTLEEKYRSFSFAFLTRLTAACDLRSLSDCFVLFSIAGGE